MGLCWRPSPRVPGRRWRLKCEWGLWSERVSGYGCLPPAASTPGLLVAYCLLHLPRGYWLPTKIGNVCLSQPKGPISNTVMQIKH